VERTARPSWTSGSRAAHPRQCYGHVTVHMGCATLNSMREMAEHDEAR